MKETLVFDSNARSTQSATPPERSEEQAAEFEAVMQRDRNFFLAHPERDWYVRPITLIELAEGVSMGNAVTKDALVLVGEVVPGSRIRWTFWDGGLPPVEEFRVMQRQIRQEWGEVSWTQRSTQARQQRSVKGKGIWVMQISEQYKRTDETFVISQIKRTGSGCWKNYP